MTLSVGCADDESPIGGVDETTGEEEAGEAGEAGEGGEELEACDETITVLADANSETPEGHLPADVLALVLGAHDVDFAAAELEQDVSVVTSVSPVLQAQIVVSYEGGEIRYIDSIPADGSEATCAPRIEADVFVSVETADLFFHAKFETPLVSHIGDEGLEAPMILQELADLGELGSVELLEIEPADPTALSYALSFVFAADGLTGELGGVASYEQAGLDGDIVTSDLGFEVFLFSE